MRLIDADAYSAEMKERQEAAWKWRNEAIAEEDEVKLARAEGAFTAFTEAKLTMDKHIISPWHRVGEKPRDGQECIVAYSGPTDWIYEHATYHSDLNKALEEDIFIDGTDGFIVDGDVGYARHSFNYWMPIEPPKEDE